MVETDPDVVELTYEPHGAAAALWDTFAGEVLLDGAAGTGKTRAILTRIFCLCDEYPNVRALICRDTRTSCTESILVTCERDVLPPGFPGLADVTRGGRNSYNFPNGSTIVVGGLDHPEKLYSTEWDIVYVAEATEISEDAWEKFARAMRNKAIPRGVSGGPQQPGEARAMEPHPVTKEPTAAFWTQRMADCNPGAPGHWLNQRANAGKMVRLKSRHEDNPSVSEGFLSGLRALSGHRRARLYEGRWVAAEGSVFPEFVEERHKCKPFKIPGDWATFLSKDPGRNHRDVTLAIAVSPVFVELTDRLGIRQRIHKLFIVQESVTGNESPSGIPSSTEQDAKIIETQFDSRFRIVKKLGDPHMMFNATKFAQKGESIADQMRAFGQHFQPAPAASNAAEIAAQCELVRTYLTTNDSEGRPMLEVFETCPCTINSFQSWPYKRTAAGEVMGTQDQFGEEGKDEMDCVRMIIASKPTYESHTFRMTRHE